MSYNIPKAIAAFFALFLLIGVAVAENAPVAGSAPKPDDNPGLKYLEEATEKKLQHSGSDDLTVVIDLCERAIKEGLSGENLDFAKQLLAVTRLQRGLFVGENMLNARRRLPKGWETMRDRAIDDLKAAAEIPENRPKAYLMLAQLAILPPGDEKAMRDALDKVIESAEDDKESLIKALALKVQIEPDVAKREAIIAQALEASDNAPELLKLQADDFIVSGKYDEAFAVIRKLLELMPENRELVQLALSIREEQKKYDDVLKMIDVLLKDDAEDAELLGRKARVLTRQKKYDEAVEIADKLVERFPDNPRFFSLALDIRDERRDFDAAIKLIDDKLQKDGKDDPDLLFRKAILYYKYKKYDEAIGIFGKLHEEYPDNPRILLLRGEAYKKKKDYDKAMDDAEAALKAAPDEPLLQSLKVEILAERKQYDEAETLVDQSLENAKKIKNPDVSLELQVRTAALYLTCKRSAKALGIADAVLEKKPAHTDALRVRANALLNLGRHSDAVNAYEEILKIEPKDEVVLNNLSWVLSTSPLDSVRNGEKSLELALKACEESDYKEAYILSTLAAAYAELGDFDKAREWSQKCLDVAKSDGQEERLDDMKKELESYKKNEPWRERFEEEE